MSRVDAEISPENDNCRWHIHDHKMGPTGKEDPYLLQPTGFDSSQGTEQLCRMTILLLKKVTKKNSMIRIRRWWTKKASNNGNQKDPEISYISGSNQRVCDRKTGTERKFGKGTEKQQIR